MTLPESAVMATAPELPSNFHISTIDTITTILKRNELRISNIYLFQARSEPSTTSLTIVNPNGYHGFGMGANNVANNWVIYNGPNPSKDVVVARAQGLHTQSGDWHNSFFTIVFEIDELKGSSLQVMGVDDQQGDQRWSIVGGTGVFTLAQGFIYRRLPKKVDAGNITQLDVYAIFHPTKINIRYGLVGGTAGTAREPAYEPHSLDSITIRYDDHVIYSIEFTYIDQNGTKRSEGPWGWGVQGMKTSTVRLRDNEYVKEVKGTVGRYLSYDVVSSLEIITNLGTVGTYGKPSENHFSFPEKKDGVVVGFFGRSGEALDALGVIVRV